MLREQLGDRLSVELNTAPTVDLNKVLDEMRGQYETVLANNHRDMEEWFAVQVSIWSSKMPGIPIVPYLPSLNQACVTDGGAEPAAAVQCRAAAGLPDGDAGTETHSHCSGD